MATEVEVNYAVNAAEGQTTLRGINKELKNLVALQGQVAAGSKEFKKLQDAINRTEGKLGDLTDSFRTLRGSGVERLNSSMSLFREGLLNADTEKLKIGLQGIGGAMKAIPIFLLVEGIMLLIQNFDKVTGFIKNLVGGLNEQEQATKRLNAEYDRQVALNDRLILNLTNETKLLIAKKAPLEQILELEQKTFEAKLANLKIDLERERMALKNAETNRTFTDSMLAFFGALTGNAAMVAASNESVFKSIEDTAKKINTVKDTIANTEVDKEVSKINRLNEIREREAKNQEERIKKVQDLIQAKAELEEWLAENQSRVEKEEHEKQLAEIVKQIENEKRLKKEAADWDQALAEQEAREKQALEENLRNKRFNDLRNDAAKERAHHVQTTGERISDIEQRMKIELANEQLTMDQRVAIIQKGEADIRNIKLQSHMQMLQLTQMGADLLSNIYQIQAERDNQRLREQEYAKNNAIAEDNRRTQEAIDMEVAATESILSNDSLTAQQRTVIKYESEKRINDIEKQSKMNQYKAESEFHRAQIKIKKAQFEKEKQLKLVNIAIDTASALVKTTAELGGVGALTPEGIAILAGITALGIAQAKVVSGQQFDEGGSAMPPPPEFGGSISMPASGGSSRDERSPTPFNPDAKSNRTPGKQKIGVLESDIRETMQKVEVWESRATFGV